MKSADHSSSSYLPGPTMLNPTDSASCADNTSLPAGKRSCSCEISSMSSREIKTGRKGPSRRARGSRLRKPRFRFPRNLKTEGTNYDLITSVEYLNEKYGIRKSHYIEKFLKCIHRKIDYDVNRLSDKFVNSLNPWIKIKLFLLLVTLSQRGGPEYWMDKNEQNHASPVKGKQKQERRDGEEDAIFSLTEQVMRYNINEDFTESAYDENYVFSSIWANFMEGLINHYLEQVIVPHSEMKVCEQLYKPMMKIISLYNEYNELMEKSERNGFLPSRCDTREGLISEDDEEATQNMAESSSGDGSTQERLQRAQKLLWQARQDIPKTISKELTLLSEMYSTLSADEQDYELDEFVCCAEEYIELEYLPSLIEVLFANCGGNNFWKIMIALEPFFYYIEGISEDEDKEDDSNSAAYLNTDKDTTEDLGSQSFKPDQRVVILEKICEVAARQKWI
ncbi:hypothetical protein HG536_0G00630 [Torulaspora globosa]|uniref:Uncharacterized protein n=1 Tax=Torulaspora globosa TaxID=48254 RepID=A0A7G3ZL20_9SACH|nr:uncharacterized protein HG536_0G00630 [Torulaspora globosa]QLL34206.1 hypothetical protein HG536_0G00630 [Torulaspora globosa]